MSSEDQELLAKIGELAGKINRHKHRQTNAQGASGHRPSHHRDNAYRHGGYQHRVGRAPAAPHRHRSLVLNHTNTSPPASNASASASDTAPIADSSQASSTWVSKNSRHRQLINSAVYQKENENRTKAIEATRQQRVAAQNTRETESLSRHLQRQQAPVVFATSAAPATNPPTAQYHEIVIQNIPFRVVQKGSKLVKAPGDVNPPSATPKITFVGGVKFHRSKNGNLYRDGVLKAHRQTGVKKVNEPCRVFSATGTCLKGPNCRFIHDANKVAVCKDFLQRRQCTHGDACDLSHDLTPQRVPTCLHYVKGNCAKFECRYTHQDISPGAPVCRSFGIYGYCEKGRDCADRHVAECPDFSNTGKCTTKGCKLLHRERASVLRKAGSALQQPQQQQHAGGGSGGGGDEEMEDLSSDEESVDSDDVDSDEVDEFLGGSANGTTDSDVEGQRDFIAF